MNIKRRKQILTSGVSAFCAAAAALISAFTGKVKAEPAELKVIETIPANGGRSVPLKSGIEVTFNREVSAEAFEGSFRITPSVDGYVTEGDEENTLIFCPYQKYSPRTEYMVTIGAGLKGEDGSVLNEDVTVVFNTADEDLREVMAGIILVPSGQGNVVNAQTDEIPAAFLMLQEDIIPGINDGKPEAEVTLYRFESDDDFRRALVKRTNSRMDCMWGGIDSDPSGGYGIREEAHFTLHPEAVSDDDKVWWWNYREYILSFPEALDEGKYLAKVDFPVKTKYQKTVVTKYMLMQSSELSTFCMSSGKEFVAWIHNGIDGTPAADAEIMLYGSGKDFSGKTAADGTARLVSGDVKIPVPELSEDLLNNSRILEVRADEHTYIEAISDIMLYNSMFGVSGNRDEYYYTYIYTDRQIYRSTDEVKFFGVIRPRYADIKIPESLKVSLKRGWKDVGTVTEASVAPDENGCFTGTLRFEDQEARRSSLFVSDEDGNVLLWSERFSIQDYVKPVYTWTSGTDKPVYVLGKDRDASAKISIDVSYFDGTPVQGMELCEEWAGAGLDTDGTVLAADEKGHTETVVGFRPDDFENSWYPVVRNISYMSAEAEDEQIFAEQPLYVIPRDVMLRAEYDRETETLNVHTNEIDVSEIAAAEDLYKDDALKGEGISTDVSGTVYKCWYEKISDGMKYDHIYKRSYEAYHYDYHEDIVERCLIHTVDGEGSFAYHCAQDEENPACYYIKLETADSAGRNVECTASLCYRSLGRFAESGNAEPVYTMKAANAYEPEPEDISDWRWYVPEGGRFSEDRPAEFMLTKDGEEFVLPEGGALLTASLMNGFTNIEVDAENTRSVDFSESLLPNYLMTGAYFDGKNTWPLRRTSMIFDYETRRLEIELTPDKEKYRPGDEVGITAHVTKSADGSAVPEGSTVVLSAADEAVFALEEQEIRILEDLYSSFSIYYYDYSSKNTLKPSGIYEENDSMEMAAAPMAANGNEGEHVRTDFRDAAFFEYAKTDADGNASFTFKIPDNMTSWRLSALSVTEDVCAGQAKENIVCTLPYYTVPVLNDIMLEGESFAVGLRSAGTMEASGVCSYEVSVFSEDETEPVMSGAAEADSPREYTAVVLDGLTEGAYRVRIKGTCGEYSDISEYPFEVVRSGLQAYAAKTCPVSEMTELHPLRYPAELTIYDKDAYVYNNVLFRLLCSREIRADERLGEHYALTVLSESYQDWYALRLKEHDISDLSAVFPNFAYAKCNAEISALSYLAVPELLAGGAIRGMTPEDIGNNPDSPYTGNSASAYLMQALSGDVLSADPAALLSEEAQSFRSRIYLMAAMFVSGETDAAEAAYEEYVLPYLKSAEAVSGQVVYSVDVDPETTVQDDTAAALIMASLLHREEARGLTLYLLEKPSDRNIYPLEMVLYLKNCEEKDSAPCTVSYVLNGETVTETLEHGRTIHLRLQKMALETLDLTAVSGEPYVTALYITGLDELTDESTMKLTASVTTDRTEYKVGDTAKVTVVPGIGNLDASIGCSTMVLDVILPSGMRFDRYTPDQTDFGHWHLVSREGQRLRFMIYDGSADRTGDFSPVTFYASCVTPGDYIVEKVYLSSNHYDTWGLSARGSVKIITE